MLLHVLLFGRLTRQPRERLQPGVQQAGVHPLVQRRLLGLHPGHLPQRHGPVHPGAQDGPVLRAVPDPHLLRVDLLRADVHRVHAQPLLRARGPGLHQAPGELPLLQEGVRVLLRRARHGGPLADQRVHLRLLPQPPLRRLQQVRGRQARGRVPHPDQPPRLPRGLLSAHQTTPATTPPSRPCWTRRCTRPSPSRST